MDSEKVGKFIKKLRQDNNLTQKDLADKYNVTYQAVSKWERGINLPDISLLKQMSKDFNISLEEILDGEINNKKTYFGLLLVLIIMLILSFLVVVISINKKDSFKFKTITANCKEFNVTGSIAYNKDKSSLYISNINYCGGDDNTIYNSIECSLYEKHDNKNILIDKCDIKNNINLENYLNEIELKIDNYEKSCKNFNNDSLYLEINAKDNNDKNITYKIPLKLNDNCN